MKASYSCCASGIGRPSGTRLWPASGMRRIVTSLPWVRNWVYSTSVERIGTLLSCMPAAM